MISIDGLEVEDVNCLATVHEAGEWHKKCHMQGCQSQEGNIQLSIVSILSPVKDVSQAHQAENPQELHDLFSPVWH